MIESGVLASNGKLLCACLQSALQSAVVLQVSRPSEHQTPRGIDPSPPGTSESENEVPRPRRGRGF